MLTLYLLRHGKAANPEESIEDYDRPLNKKGIAQINQVGKQLETAINSSVQIISSAALRTKETAQIANFYLKSDNIAYHKDLYLASSEEIILNIIKLSNSAEIIYVGHNFGISDLASELLNGRISMSTGMLLSIKFDTDDWTQVQKAAAKLELSIQPNVYIP